MDIEEHAKEILGPALKMYVAPYIGGGIVDTFCAGIVAGLAVHFWLLSTDEPRYVRIAVLWSTVTTIITTVFTWAYTANTLVNNYGLYAPYVAVNWRAWYGLLDPVTYVPVQLFFAHRAYRLSKNSRVLALAILLFLSASTLGAILYVPFEITRGVQFTPRGRTPITVTQYFWFAGGVAADVLTAGSILFNLTRTKSEWSDTDTVIKRLMIISTESQLPPAVLSIVIIVVGSIVTNSYLSYFFQRFQAKLYVVGFLWALNSRINLRVEASNQIKTHGTLARTYGLNPHTPAVIQVNTETYVQSDKDNLRPHPTPKKAPTFRPKTYPKDASYPPSDDMYELQDRELKKADLEVALDDTDGDEDEDQIDQDQDQVHTIDFADNNSRTGLTDKRDLQ